MDPRSTPSMGWYDPPDQHELCGCGGCHAVGAHYQREDEFPGCGECEKVLDTMKALEAVL